jgi:pimeloyl-ACP methyl ester carboxylesterase
MPRSAIEHGRLLVSIHGVSRNADQHARLLSAYCESYRTALVAPIFSVEEFPDYQRLGRAGRGKRADIALNMIVAEAAAIAGVSGERFNLFGYSGGAQFAHRYLMANPHRVTAAVIAAAGWYTWPDATRRFPYGTRMNKRLPDVRFDAEDFLCVPITVMVGSGDNDRSGLRQSKRLDREQGATRVERARRWVAAMQAAAEMHHLESRVSYVEVEDCGHSFRNSVLRAGLGEKVFSTLFAAQSARAALSR